MTHDLPEIRKRNHYRKFAPCATFVQEGLGQLSEDSEEIGDQPPLSASFPTLHSFPWLVPAEEAAPLPVEAPVLETVEQEQEEQPLELVKRKQEPTAEGKPPENSTSFEAWQPPLIGQLWSDLQRRSPLIGKQME
jgi:hypothetical protein